MEARGAQATRTTFDQIHCIRQALAALFAALYSGLYSQMY
jgi:hypothetical protein